MEVAPCTNRAPSKCLPTTHSLWLLVQNNSHHQIASQTMGLVKHAQCSAVKAISVGLGILCGQQTPCWTALVVRRLHLTLTTPSPGSIPSAHQAHREKYHYNLPCLNTTVLCPGHIPISYLFYFIFWLFFFFFIVLSRPFSHCKEFWPSIKSMLRWVDGWNESELVALDCDNDLGHG